MKVELGYNRAYALETQQYLQPSRGNIHSSRHAMLSLLAEGPSTASQMNQCLLNRTADCWNLRTRLCKYVITSEHQELMFVPGGIPCLPGFAYGKEDRTQNARTLEQPPSSSV
jgi:hypothetical protein